jgi:alkanesulfonate monooxygenase SsuD/methylene tetrahydromethanopterin reductase-like flavin-dependent oxidoreductase (luciferase family)
MVTGNTYRHPCITAKMAATDRPRDAAASTSASAPAGSSSSTGAGIDFKTVPGRLAALDEALTIIRGMFTQPKTTLRGKHYTVTDAMCLPKPVQTPHPPIMIGGTGKRVLLKLVARHADMWNASASAEDMRALVDVITRHAEVERRDPSTIEKTVMMAFCYGAKPEREQFVCQIVANMRQTTRRPRAARS